MKRLLEILKLVKKYKACNSRLNKLIGFIESNNEAEAWSTILGNIYWLGYENIIQKDEALKYTSVAKTWHSNGKLASYCNYIDGKTNGLFEGFHDNGKLELSCNYINGQLNGLCQIFFDNGKLELSCNYINGEIVD